MSFGYRLFGYLYWLLDLVPVVMCLRSQTGNRGEKTLTYDFWIFRKLALTNEGQIALVERVMANDLLFRSGQGKQTFAFSG